jgi:hypothetical protein
MNSSYKVLMVKWLVVFGFINCLIQHNLNAQGQRFKAGLTLGVTAAQINGDDSANFNKLGFSAGLKAITILTSKSDVHIELLYSQRGSRTELGGNSGLPQRIINLHYIEVPIIYTLKDWYQEEEDYHKMHFQAGLSYGRLFSSSFQDSPLEAAAPFFRENDFSWVAGLTFHTSAHLGFFGRYTRSINLLYKNNGTNPNVNSLLSFFLTFGGTYIF